MDGKKSISIRMDPKLLNKLRYIAGSEARSINSQIIYLVQKLVVSYEQEHGEITEEDMKDVQR